MSKDKKQKPIGQVTLKGVRMSFDDIDKPAEDRKDQKTGETIKGKYKANFLMSKGTPLTKKNMAAIKAASQAVKEAKWGDNVPKIKPERLCCRDGDLEDWDGYPDCFYVSSNNKDKPRIVGKDPTRDVERGDKEWPLAGHYVNAIITIWAQDNEPDKGGKRINASLEAIQFKKEGPLFSGRVPVVPEDEFEDESEEGEIGEDFPDEDDEPPRKKKKSRRADPEDEEDEDDEPPRKKKKSRRADPEDYEDDDSSLI